MVDALLYCTDEGLGLEMIIIGEPRGRTAIGGLDGPLKLEECCKTRNPMPYIRGLIPHLSVTNSYTFCLFCFSLPIYPPGYVTVFPRVWRILHIFSVLRVQFCV